MECTQATLALPPRFPPALTVRSSMTRKCATAPLSTSALGTCTTNVVGVASAWSNPWCLQGWEDGEEEDEDEEAEEVRSGGVGSNAGDDEAAGGDSPSVIVEERLAALWANKSAGA
mmetsp:Transcript_39117/g.77128  ORF Transcript_39117/g.77128 Transcript_39117/m.77128 type:complete len:116 (-) Transcript_39117:98-445(-)